MLLFQMLIVLLLISVLQTGKLILVYNDKEKSQIISQPYFLCSKNTKHYRSIPPLNNNNNNNNKTTTVVIYYWHKAKSIGHPVKIKITSNGLLD